MTKTKETGITLIALIITIIVMLILVGVTVAVALNGGLFTTAKNATNKYTVEKEKELITIGYSEYEMKKIAPRYKEDVELLEKYFEYFFTTGKEPVDENYKFISNEIISDANSSLLWVGYGIDFNKNSEFVRVLYNNNIYRLYIEDKIEIKLESTKNNLEENTTELEILQNYFLKDDKQFEDFLDNDYRFINSEDLNDANESLTFIGSGEEIVEGEQVGAKYFVQYKNYIYDVIASGDVDDYYGRFNETGIDSIKIESLIINPDALEVQDANVDGNEDYGWTITFDGTGHVYTLLPDGTILEPEEPREKTDGEKLVEKYFLGQNGEGIDLTTIMPGFLSDGDMTFANNEIISDASSSMQMFVDAPIELQDENYNTTGYKLYIEYNRNIYKATTIFNYEENILKTEGIELIYAPTGREGQTITYSYDGTKEHEEEWTILYDNGSTIEIVSPNTMGSLKLGADNWQDIDKAITSYNGAISELNKYCREQITNNNKISVRSAGSDPVNPLKENTTLYTSTYLKDTAYDKKAKSPDNNWEQDVIRMLYWGITKTSDAQSYWLASRITYMEQRTQYI